MRIRRRPRLCRIQCAQRSPVTDVAGHPSEAGEALIAREVHAPECPHALVLSRRSTRQNIKEPGKLGPYPGRNAVLVADVVHAELSGEPGITFRPAILFNAP